MFQILGFAIPFLFLLCEKIQERGGERLGPKKTLIYQLIQVALQRKDSLGMIFEGLQWDDKHYFGMRDKVDEAVAAAEPIIQHVNPRADTPVPGMMSWPPGESRDDQLYNTLCVEDYVGATFWAHYSRLENSSSAILKRIFHIRRFKQGDRQLLFEAWKLRKT